MIDEIHGLPDHVIGFRGTGKVTSEDYENVVIPAIERARQGHDKIRLLFQLGPDLEGFTPGAIVDDARVGLRNYSAFERIAVVTDTDWVRNAVRLFSFAIPCPVKVFTLTELDQGRAWVME